jgi:hypothetical protein
VRIIAFILVTASAALSAQSAPPRQQEIEHVAAFARLYGVTRYFYPSDAAASLDWNRFSVHGVHQVRSAPDAAALETTLERLFAPLGPGIVVDATLPPPPQIGAPDPALVAWRYVGPGGMSGATGPYTAGRINRAGPPDANVFITVMQSLPAAELRGKTIRLTARARVSSPDAVGWAGLWLRVDRPNQQVGFFDNMQDRPIRSHEWRDYLIEGPVADDATAVMLGPLSSGALSAEFDSFELSALVDATWTPLPLRNTGFEEGAGPGVEGWQRAGTARAGRATVETTDAADGQRYLRLISAPGDQAPAAEGAALDNAHVDIDLGSGHEARVRLSLTDAEASASTPALADLRQAIASVPTPGGRSDLEVRLADVVVAWNVLRHFYPYWEEAGVDWDARLHPQLELAAAAEGRSGHRDALRLLAAAARDGHGGVIDNAAGERRAMLPIQLALVEGRVVVTASAVPGDAPIGSTVTAIGDRSSSELLGEEMRLTSGSRGWRESRALRELVSCAQGSTVTIHLEPADGRARQAALPCTTSQFVPEPRPDAIAQLAPGIWYVDLTRATRVQIAPMLPALAEGTGIVFDLRGYPTDAGAFILSHLIEAPEADRWMHVPHIAGPFGQVERWQSVGWNLEPATPHLAARRVFLTDGRAISYAESVMGYVGDRKLATIIGDVTAGANGNVAAAQLPGGFTMTFTGMRVTRHDGRTPFHLAGVTPDISLRPTLAGLRAGRDELLERALEVLRAQPASTPHP